MTPPPIAQASNSSVVPHTLVVDTQQSVAAQQRQASSSRVSIEPQVGSILVSDPVTSRAPTKPTCSPLNIIEKMKKSNVSIPMWNLLTFPSQRELLQ